MKRVTVVNTQKNSGEQEMNKTMEEKITEFEVWRDKRLWEASVHLGRYSNQLEILLNANHMKDTTFLHLELSCLCQYIDESVTEAKMIATDNCITAEILEEVIHSLGLMKKIIREVEAEYKVKFAMLREICKQTLKDKESVHKNEVIVGNVIKEWCVTHEVKSFAKSKFEGDALLKEIKKMTRNIMKIIAYPDEIEIKEFVEAYMESCSVIRDIA